MSFWTKLYSFRTRTYREEIPKLTQEAMCQLISKDSHGFIFRLVDYPGLEARLTYRNAHSKRRSRIINKLFTNYEKLYPLTVVSVEYHSGKSVDMLDDLEQFESENEGSDSEGGESDQEDPNLEDEEPDAQALVAVQDPVKETEEEEEKELNEETEEEPTEEKDTEKPFVMLSNLGLSPEHKKEVEQEYHRYLQILGIIHKYAIESFKKSHSKSRPDQMDAYERDLLFQEYKNYVQDIVKKTIWKLPADKVFSYFNDFKNKYREDTHFDLDRSQKKILATLVRKQLRNPDYTIDYYFELTTIRFSLDDSQSGYHFLTSIFKKAMDSNQEQINQIDRDLTIKLKNVTDVSKDGHQISKKTQDSLSYSVHGKSKNEKALRELVDDIINSIQKLKGPFEDFKKLEVSLHNSETHQVDNTKFCQ